MINMSKETRKIALLWLILAAANLLLHFPILKGYFYYDDFQILGQLKDYPTWTGAVPKLLPGRGMGCGFSKT